MHHQSAAATTAGRLRRGEHLAGFEEPEPPWSRVEAHRQFHVALVAMVGHRHLLLVYEPVILKLQVYMAANLRREAQARTTHDGVRCHQRLFDAVAAGHADQVLAALGDHGARSFLA